MLSVQPSLNSRISINSVGLYAQEFAQQKALWQQSPAQRLTLIGPQLEAFNHQAIAQAVAQNGQKIESIVHAFFAGNVLNPNPSSWGQHQEQLCNTLHAAHFFKARSVYLLTGGHSQLPWEESADIFSQAIAPCRALAQDLGIHLLIENAPMQYADLHLAHSLRDTVTLATQAKLGICIDLFFCWAEADLHNTMKQAVPICQLVQVSDYCLGDRNLPARAVPGDGDIPLKRLLTDILTLGYQGALELELIGPRIEAEGGLAACERGCIYLDNFLQTFN